MTRRKQNPHPQAPAGPATTQPTGWKLWARRLCAAAGIPLLCLLILELILRFTGFGYPTAFLLRSSNHGQKTFIQNDRFGWRFFGPSMARLPNPISISREKPAGTIRIFVLGESAAFGDPQPRFGLPRMIEALLELRHPGVNFEVVNAAMTGINSHVIVPIARDCSRAGGDIWVIYMGNNEVVGPFGAGTVFGQQAPPVPLVRANLALKSSRAGQLLDAALHHLHREPADNGEWGGMMMFVNNEIRFNDPRMETVYRNFERNLQDIIRMGQRVGAGVVVSMVAVNLDCGPFRSLHRANASAEEIARWAQSYQLGLEAFQAGDFPGSLSKFQGAAAIDDTVADLHFRLGQCERALGRLPQARQEFTKARDLDALRFRCDTKLNDLTRRTASGHEADRILLADADREFVEQEHDGIPGGEFFYEHVHLTFKGNYFLGRTIAAQIEKLLPTAGLASTKSWPSSEDCARRLAWTQRDQQAAVTEILARLTDPPFTAQADHNAQVQRLTLLAQQLAPANSPPALHEDLSSCQNLVAAWPQDALLFDQLASLAEACGDFSAAETAAKRALDLVPSNTEGWFKLGFLFVQQQKFTDAVVAYRRALELDSQNVWAMQDLALSLVKLNRPREALVEYRRALAIKPRFGPAWLGLGQLLETMNRKAEAQGCFQQALTNRIHRASDLRTLARFCGSRGWREAAATNYDDAINLDSSDAKLRFESAQNLAALGRHSEAARRYAEVARLSPDFAQAHFLCGLEFGRSGKPAEAASEFREALRLMPDLMEAHLNLGIALANTKQYSNALAEFQLVLDRNPTNSLALRYAEALRKTITPP